MNEPQLLAPVENALPNNGKGILQTPLVVEKMLPRTPLKNSVKPSLVDEEGFQRVERRRNIFKAHPRGRLLPPLRNFVPRGGYARGPNLIRGATSSREGKAVMEVDQLHPSSPPSPISQGPPRSPLESPRGHGEHTPIKEDFKDIIAKGLANRINRIREVDLEVVPSSQVGF